MVDEFEVSILQTINNLLDISKDKEMPDYIGSVNQSRVTNGLDPIPEGWTRTEIIEANQKDIDRLTLQFTPKAKVKKPSFNKWFKENFEKDPDHTYWTSIQERQDGMAPGDLSRYYSKEEIKKEWNELK